MPFNYTEQEATRTLGGHELIEVEQGMQTDYDGYCGNREVAISVRYFREVTRSWVMFPSGVLKDVKTELNE